jgi:hypothetical protein
MPGHKGVVSAIFPLLRHFTIENPRNKYHVNYSKKKFKGNFDTNIYNHFAHDARTR